MKKLVAAAVLCGAMLGAPLAYAQTSTATFNVNVTLTSVCSLSPITAVDFAYTSFQGGVANGTNGNFTMTCTTSLPYTFGLQTGSGAAAPPGSPTINVTDDAVNLAYTLATTAAGGTGNGAAQAYRVTGTMAAGQGGTCNTASCSNALATNRTHRLIVTY